MSAFLSNSFIVVCDKTFIKFSKNDEELIVDIIKNMAKSKYQILNLNLRLFLN